MTKKRSPRKIIESADPSIEHAWIKIPGKELAEVTIKSSGDEVTVDEEKILKLIKGKKYFSHIHVHPYDLDKPESSLKAHPSHKDLSAFITSANARYMKTMHVAQINTKTRKLEGYVTIRKTKASKEPHKYSEKDERSWNWLKDYPVLYSFAYNHFLNIRYTPAKGYYFDKKEERFKKKLSNLEKSVSTTAIVGLMSGLFFLSSNLTGNVIGLNHPTGNVFGVVLLIIGLVSSFFWFKIYKCRTQL